MSSYVLTDGLIALRPVEKTDVDFVWRLELEPNMHDGIGLMPRSEAERRIEKGYWGEKSRVFVVELDRDNEREPVGVIGSDMENWNNGIEIGTSIMSKWRGVGVGTRAKVLLCDYLLATYPVERIEIMTWTENAAARRSTEKAGFTLEGISRREKFIRGDWRDFARYSILREEFAAAKERFYSTAQETIEPRKIPESEQAKEVLEGKLINLRPVGSEHMGFLARLFSNQWRFLHHEFVAEDEMKKENEAEDSLWGKKNRVFLIESKDGEVLGKVGIWSYDERNRFAEVGTLILPEVERGKGYGTEAKLLCMDYAFQIWPLNRIWAGTNQYNRAARCSLSRAGLRLTHVFSGVHTGTRCPDGAALYDVTREEFYGDRRTPDA